MQILYHASPHKDLKTIQPKRTLSRDVYIGDYVFATSDIRLAAMYLATKGTAILLNVDYEVPRVVICSEANDYIANDKGGAIYTVPATSFTNTPQKGLEKSELVSKVAVKPIDKKLYERSLDAMKEANIAVYFVNPEKFNKLVDAKDESAILSSLTPYLV